ncbi:MAG: DUF2723 domain-containing protein [Sandaracinaceae bacterium]|nr:DUF2723 domain-containing protein [Sandaracinaceae bacterium]
MTERLRAALRLGLPLGEPAFAWIAPAVLFAVYAATMARDLTFYDSPELALVAHELGVGHPIGMPLHTLIGFAFAHLPPSPHVGLTAMSALFGALCAVPAWSIADRFGPVEGAARWARVAVFVGLGLSVVAWEPSSRVEVYTLAVFLSLWGVARAADRPGFLAGLAFGLGATAHAVIAVAHAFGALPRVLSRDPESLDAPPPERDAKPAVGMVDRSAPVAEGSRGGRFLAYAAGALLGLLPYALLPVVAADPRRFAWGAPRDAASLLEYLRGGDYQHNQGIALGDWLDHLGQLAAWGLEHGALPVLVVGGAAFVVLGHARGRVGYAFAIAGGLCVAFVAANVVFHPDVPDYSGYFLGPLWLAGVGVSAGAERLMARGGRFVAYGAAIAAFPALAVLPSPQHLLQVRDDPSLARITAQAALDEAPPGAVIVVEADHHVAPLLYLQEVEGARPDVVVLAVGLASSSWYWEHVYARHASLARFELVARGGDDRGARVRRFLDAQPSRRVLVESSAVAFALGRIPCGVGALVWTSPPGAEPTACGDPGPDATTRAIAGAAPLRGESLEVAARIDEARGEALWRLGFGRAALEAMLAGLPESGVGPAVVDCPERAAPLTGPLPGWGSPHALHDPARNLALAGLLLQAAGRGDAAGAFVEAARQLGLVEASVALERNLGHR